MKRQDKLELVFASLIAVSVIVSLIFAIAIVSPEQGVLQGTQSTAATSNSVQDSVSISTDTIIIVTTETTATTLTFSHISVIPAFSTQVITYTTQSTETLPVFSTISSTTSQASTTTDSQTTSQSSSTIVSTTTAVITTTYTTTPITTISTTTSTSSTTDSTTGSTTTANSAVATTLTLSCSPSEFQLGLSSVCTATVTGSNWQYPPTGQVSFSSTLPATFTPASCTLKGSTSASCTSTFTPKGPTTGYYTITANYLGDAGHFGSSGAETLIVPPPASTLVSCFPGTLSVNATAFCVVTVQNTQDFPSPTGTISLFSNMPGTFDKASCTLDASASCSVHYSPGKGSAGSTTTITGTYSGDLYHASSLGTAQLTVT